MYEHSKQKYLKNKKAHKLKHIKSIIKSKS